MMKWFSKAVILILWVFALPIFAQEIPTQTVDLGDDYVLTVPQSWAVKRIQDGAFTVSGGSLTITVTTPTLLQKLNIRFDSSTPIIDVLASLALPFNGVQVVPADVALSTTEGRESASYTNTTNATVDQRYAVVMLGDGTFGYITITGVKGGLDKQEDAINAMIASFKNATAPVPTATPTVPSPTPSDTPTDTATPVPTDTPTPQPTDTATPIPTDTPVPPTDTPVPPTSTPVPTDTLVPPTDTAVPPTNTVAPAITSVPPTDTPVPPTSTPVPTDTLVPPTDTPVPTDTLVPPTSTPVPTDTLVPPTDTPVPPTSTPVPTDTPIPPTNTPVPTDTPVPPTDTPVPPTSTLVPTDTPVPPTNTPVPPTATDTATPLPTNTATPLPTATPTVPTATPSDTATPEPCMVSIDRKNSATLRVGPGTNRGAISYLLPNSPTLVTGRAQLADGSVWYQLDKDQAAPSGTEAAELWVSADEIYTSGACDNIGVVATPPIIRRASATPEGGESTAEVTSEATSQPTDTPTSESTGTPTRTPSATVTQAAPTEAAPTATPEVVIAPPEGSIVPINGNWQLTFNAETNRSCQGGQNEVVQSADVFENPTFSARLRVIDRDKFSYGSDVYVRVPGTNTFTGQFTIEHNENAQVWLTLNSNVSIFGQVTNNYSDGSKPCSATALFLLERQ